MAALRAVLSEVERDFPPSISGSQERELSDVSHDA